jgi:hypothetical protein
MTYPRGFETLWKNGNLGLFSLTTVDNHYISQSAKYANCGRVTKKAFGKWQQESRQMIFFLLEHIISVDFGFPMYP